MPGWRCNTAPYSPTFQGRWFPAAGRRKRRPLQRFFCHPERNAVEPKDLMASFTVRFFGRRPQNDREWESKSRPQAAFEKGVKEVIPKWQDEPLCTRSRKLPLNASSRVGGLAARCTSGCMLYGAKTAPSKGCCSCAMDYLEGIANPARYTYLLDLLERTECIHNWSQLLD